MSLREVAFVANGVPRSISIGDVLRYGRPRQTDQAVVDGLPNFFYLTNDPNQELHAIQLESGISAPAPTVSEVGVRRSVIMVRSSPWKSGTAEVPWKDELRVGTGSSRYFGDAKPGDLGPPEARKGNALLLEAQPLFASCGAASRSLAPPILVFEGVPIVRDGRTMQKGQVAFRGVAALASLELVECPVEGESVASFPNYQAELFMMDLSADLDSVDCRWFDDRRDVNLSHEDAARHAPSAWREWIFSGSHDRVLA